MTDQPVAADDGAASAAGAGADRRHITLTFNVSGQRVAEWAEAMVRHAGEEARLHRITLEGGSTDWAGDVYAVTL